MPEAGRMIRMQALLSFSGEFTDPAGGTQTTPFCLKHVLLSL